jgi:hypothetical protein
MKVAVLLSIENFDFLNDSDLSLRAGQNIVSIQTNEMVIASPVLGSDEAVMTFVTRCISTLMFHI